MDFIKKNQKNSIFCRNSKYIVKFMNVIDQKRVLRDRNLQIESAILFLEFCDEYFVKKN